MTDDLKKDAEFAAPKYTGQVCSSTRRDSWLAGAEWLWNHLCRDAGEFEFTDIYQKWKAKPYYDRDDSWIDVLYEKYSQLQPVIAALRAEIRNIKDLKCESERLKAELAEAKDLITQWHDANERNIKLRDEFASEIDQLRAQLAEVKAALDHPTSERHGHLIRERDELRVQLAAAEAKILTLETLRRVEGMDNINYVDAKEYAEALLIQEREITRVLEEALEFYKNEGSYFKYWDSDTETTVIEHDYGHTAKQALAKAKEIRGKA